MDFTTDFLLSFNPAAAAIDIAENFAVRWQKFYQTGTVCLYLAVPTDARFVEAAIVESLGQCKTVFLNVPDDMKAIPDIIKQNFTILNAFEYVDWLFEQLDIDFDKQQTKLVPLLSAGKAVGAIIFELHWPIDSNLMEENFRIVTSIAGSVLDSALNRQKQENLAECFAPLIKKSEIRNSKFKISADSRPDAIAEMAAGIAHELNNPLSVVSGRAQLLAEAETNAKKKQSLKQIQENAREASAIIEDLIGFANPPQPRPTQTNLKQIIEEAIQLVSQKANMEKISVQVKVAENVQNVLVDSAQIASAIANIISNSLESYTDEAGPIIITADAEGKEQVKLQISDTGCGMDAETLRKSIQPFFSVKPAGRKRGMGLAYAARFIQLNNGTLNITSRPGNGTTVTITLPTE
ncbi:MAG: hypothetical protein A2167_08260 [Planctomycetes bacterium RBG_13_46_10]|nr:MAG: hypothetical protein A2167_08260 [Planctomycetes bacterium RBG_13_46_10]